MPIKSKTQNNQCENNKNEKNKDQLNRSKDCASSCDDTSNANNTNINNANDTISSNKTNPSDTNIIQELNIKIKNLQDQILRNLAEIQNLQKRAAIDKENITKFAISNFAKDILIVRDNLCLAISNCSKTRDSKGDSKMESAIADGIKLTLSQFDKVLNTYGIEKIKSLGEKFDPNFHQAVSEIESDKESGTILRVMQEGFTLNKRLLRPALVEVAKEKN